MPLRALGSVLILTLLGAGLAWMAVRLDAIWIALSVVSGLVAGGFAWLRYRESRLVDEMSALRGHLDTTRQHAALLARHTRELRDHVSEVLVRQGAAASGRPGDFVTLSTLVRDLADSVAELDRRSERAEAELADLRRGAARVPGGPAPGWVAPAKPAAPSAPAPSALRSVPGEPPVTNGSEPSRAVRQLVAAAIAADRFDLFLQRIVSLPQRKVRGYEVSLRPDGADPTLSGSDIRAAVEAVGHQLTYDRKLMIQAVRLARVFAQRERDVVLVVPVSHRYLMSEAAREELDALIADAPDAPARIVLALPHRFFRKAVAFDHEAVRLLANRGFRFLMSETEGLDFDAAQLARAQVRFVRISADRFLSALQASDGALDVAAADFVALLARRKLSLIVDETMDETEVAELIDLNVEWAQGLAFAPPQAVRADLFEPLKASVPSPSPEPRGERISLRDLARRVGS